MKTFKKAILLVACAALLVGASIMGTLAFLQDKTETITNTMTVGNVAITLDESVLDANGEKTGERSIAGNAYKLVPGQTYVKDPTIHVAAGSENCYLFVKVENGVAGIEKENGQKIADQLAANGWIALANVDNVYYNSTNGTAGADVVLFERFQIKDNVDKDEWATYAGATIKITAYAVQAAGFDNAQEAWDATFGLNP